MSSFLSMTAMLWPLIYSSGHAENSSCEHDLVLLQTRSKGIPLSNISMAHYVHNVRSTSRAELLDLCRDETDEDTWADLMGEAQLPALETELEHLDGLTSNRVRVLHLNDAHTDTKTNTPLTLWQSCSEQQLKQRWVPVGHACLAANLIYIKIHKAASSTTGGIMRRIASRHGVFGVSEDLRLKSAPMHFEPVVAANHGCARCKVTLNQFGLTKPAILTTVLRDPAERALSQYYYAFVVGGEESSSKPDDVIEYLQNVVSGSYQLDYIRLDGASGVSQIIDNYSFIGIAERLTESLVVLKHLLRLKWCDLLYAISSKVSKDKTDEEKHADEPDTWLSGQAPEVRRYVASPEFSKRYELDLLLYAAANRSLDLQIDRIGRRQIQEDVSTFSRLLKQAESQCSYPIDYSKCYWMDAGCNYPCIDSLCEED